MVDVTYVFSSVSRERYKLLTWQQLNHKRPDNIAELCRHPVTWDNFAMLQFLDKYTSSNVRHVPWISRELCDQAKIDPRNVAARGQLPSNERFMLHRSTPWIYGIYKYCMVAVNSTVIRARRVMACSNLINVTDANKDAGAVCNARRYSIYPRQCN